MRLSGANANNGTNAGAFATNTNNAASNSNANVSAPLYFAVRKRLDGVKDLATWQKMTNAQKDAGRPVTVRTLPSKAKQTLRHSEPQKQTMKRYGNLFERVVEYGNLEQAFHNAARHKTRRSEVIEYGSHLEANLLQLQRELITGTYRTSEYKTFIIYEPKERKIFKLPFRDRVVHWAIMQVIEPFIVSNLTTDTYSAIPERGIHKGLTKLQAAMWNDPEECKYCLKLDARHYYQSINHNILKEKYSRMFNDNELLWLLNEIIDSIQTADIEDLTAIYLLEEDIDPETGIPIGNYLSQYSGNYYFSSFDHWIKERKYVKYYFRYMDDIVIFGKTKEELFTLKKEIDVYFSNELKLNIKGNWQVFPSYVRGVDFLGYRTFYKYTLLRKSTCLEMKKKMTAIRNKVESGNMMNYSEWCSINSYKGWLKYADTFRLYRKYIVPLLPYADDYYIRNIKPNTKKGLRAA